jgi:RimJ/RimL family protein N-acetyltransferase
MTSNRIDTPNLSLTLAQFSDASDIQRCVRESLKELAPWMPWAVHDYNLKHAQGFIQQAVANNQQAATTESKLTFVIRTKGGGFVGCGTLSPAPDPMGRSVPAYTMGYWIRTPDTNKNFATEAIVGLTHYAQTLLGAKRVEAICHSDNLASARAAEKAGLSLEARLKNTRKNTDSSCADTLIYSSTF